MPLKSVIGAAIVVACLAVAAEPDVPATAPVKTESGLVTGTAQGGVRVYKSIPYAAPPVGEWRWRAPQQPRPWDGTRAADRFGPVCMQDVPERVLKSIRMSEDCLTLNVWTAAGQPGAKLPVMMWIHGGGFRGGTGANAVFNGAALARRGVIVVTINYRLGDFGLFAHPALNTGREDEPKANYHLMDQVAALCWIRKNIAAFGGDPEQVTVFGESAGGLSVLHLMGSPSTDGLFHRAVVQSGGGFEGCRTVRELEADGQGIVSAMGIGDATSAAAALRAMPATELVARFAKARAGMGRKAPPSYAPVVDGTLVTALPGEIFQAGKQRPVPLLIGANSFEGSLVRPLGISPEKIMSLPGTRREQVRKLYGGDEGAAEEFYGDAFFVAPARFLAACMQRAQKPAWLYHFSYVPEKILGNLSGAPHGLEVPFVFANKHPNLPLSEADMAAAERIGGYWVRFTKTGDPNEAGHRIWPAYAAESDELLEFGNEAFSARKRFRKAKLDLVDELFRSDLRLPSAEGW